MDRLVEHREHTGTRSESKTAEGLRSSDHDAVDGLRLATRAWVDRGSFGPLERWLARELDASGVPIGLPISEWAAVLIELARAREARRGWPERGDARIGQFFEMVLRFSRPSGIVATTESASEELPGLRDTFRAWASAFAGTGAARVVSMWFPRHDDDESSPPPLPAWSSEKKPLAILRAEWLKAGDFLAVDHRSPAPASAFELFGGGKTWLGPTWSLSLAPESECSRPKVVAWSTSSTADLSEWTFRVGSDRVTRTAVLLRGRRLALLADQVDFQKDDGEGRPISLKLAYDPIIQTDGEEESRAITMKRGSDRASARAYPLGLPCLPYKTDRGSFHASEGHLIVRQARTSRRIWLPLLVSWDPARNRKPVQWRALTVSERSKICPPGVAFAVRASWGRDETIVIYRSLAKPGLRSFLGHQTKARFLVGSFSAEGEVKPLISLV